MSLNSYLNNAIRCTLILLLGITSQFAAANWDDEWPSTEMEIIEVNGPSYYDMNGWVTSCSGLGCQQFLDDFSKSLNEESLNLNMQDFNEVSGNYDQKSDEEKDEECGNGYTRRDMSEAYTESLLEIAKTESAWGHYLNIESTVLGGFYRNPLIGGGYRMIVGGLVSYLGADATQRVTDEYEAAMATCN